MKLKTEQDIKSTWRESDAVKISIICTTFNHERYIKDAIHGFLMQESNYPFEIIIHDDASTDSTVSIAKHFAVLYPNIIKLVVQERNQFSQGRRVSLLAFAHAGGRYIALCEGDDYWTDSSKLQTQIDEMMRYPDCDISFHSAVCIDERGIDPDLEICKHVNTTTVMSAELVILNGGGYMPTASLMVKRKVFEELPSWFSQAPVGDYFIQCIASLNAGALFINRAMSVYRTNVDGSWSTLNTEGGRIDFDIIRRIISSCHQLNLWSRFRVARAIYLRISRYYLSLCFRSIVKIRLPSALVYLSKSMYYYCRSSITI